MVHMYCTYFQAALNGFQALIYHQLIRIHLLYCSYLLFNRIRDSLLAFLRDHINMINIYSNNLNIRINTSGLKQFSSIVIFKTTKHEYYHVLEQWKLSNNHGTAKIISSCIKGLKNEINDFKTSL